MKLGANQERNIAQRRMDIRDATPETIAQYLKHSNPSAGAAVTNAKAAQGAMHGKQGSRPGSASIFAGGGGGRPGSARGKPRIPNVDQTH